MNILFVDQFSSLGGGQLCLLDELEEVRRLGWGATLAAPGGGALLDAAGSLGVETCLLQPADKRASHFLQDSMRQSANIVRTLERAHFDLIYVNGPRVLPAVVRANRWKIPVVFHAHSRPLSPVARAIAGWNIRAARATVIACCRFVADVYAAYVAPGNLHVILNGVREFAYRARTLSGRVRIGIIGRIEPEKGQLLFAEAARILLSQGVDCEFVVCGSPGPSAVRYVDAVHAAAEGMAFRFIPWQERIDSVLDSLDLLVVASSNEGLPRVVLEAFSAGLPVVALAAGGIPELVRDGETGYLVRDRTSTGLAARILDAISRGDAATVSLNGRRHWEEHHRLDLYRTRVTDVIAKAASAAAARSRRAPPRSRTAKLP